MQEHVEKCLVWIQIKTKIEYTLWLFGKRRKYGLTQPSGGNESLGIIRTWQSSSADYAVRRRRQIRLLEEFFFVVPGTNPAANRETYKEVAW